MQKTPSAIETLAISQSCLDSCPSKALPVLLEVCDMILFLWPILEPILFFLAGLDSISATYI